MNSPAVLASADGRKRQAATSPWLPVYSEARKEVYAMEVLIANAGTFGSHFWVDEIGKGYVTRPPTAFDGTHGLPLAYKRSLLLKGWSWDRDRDKEPDWIDKAVNLRPGNKTGEYSLMYADVQAEAWFVELTCEQVASLLKLETDFRLAWYPDGVSFALCRNGETPQDVVTETCHGTWAADWLEDHQP